MGLPAKAGAVLSESSVSTATSLAQSTPHHGAPVIKRDSVLWKCRSQMETSLLISKTTWAIAGLDGVGCKFMAGQLRGVFLAASVSQRGSLAACCCLLFHQPMKCQPLKGELLAGNSTAPPTYTVALQSSMLPRKEIKGGTPFQRPRERKFKTSIGHLVNIENKNSHLKKLKTENEKMGVRTSI